MKRFAFIILSVFDVFFALHGQHIVQADWLVSAVSAKATVFTSEDKKDLILDNGLLQRRFRLNPNLACTDFKNKITGQQLLRAVQPEARIVIDGKAYNIGGLYGQKEQAYLLPSWIDAFSSNRNDFAFTRYEVSDLPPYLNAQSKFWATHKKPATGKLVRFYYRQPALQGLEVVVNYELYEGAPLMAKWLSVRNYSQKAIKINRIVNEIL